MNFHDGSLNPNNELPPQDYQGLFSEPVLISLVHDYFLQDSFCGGQPWERKTRKSLALGLPIPCVGLPEKVYSEIPDCRKKSTLKSQGAEKVYSEAPASPNSGKRQINPELPQGNPEEVESEYHYQKLTL